MGGCHLSDGLDRREWVHRSASGIVGVLDTDECGLNTVWIVGANGGLDLFRRHESSPAGNPMELHPGQCRRRAQFVADDVRLAFNNDFLSRFRLGAKAELVSGGARWNEERGSFADQGGSDFLKPVDGGVFSIHIVTYLGAGHGVAHGGRWLRERIAPEIDDGLRCV